MKFTAFGTKRYGLIDYGFVAAQFLVPKLMRLSPRASAISYAFGTFQGVVNALTAQPYSARNLVSLRTHGKLETPLLPALIAVPLVAGVLKSRRARRYFLPFLAIAVCNYLLTDYNASEKRHGAAKEAKKRSVFAGVVERDPHHAINE